MGFKKKKKEERKREKRLEQFPSRASLAACVPTRPPSAGSLGVGTRRVVRSHGFAPRPRLFPESERSVS